MEFLSLPAKLQGRDIYEGTRDCHTLMQADWALGLKKEKAARKSLPAWRQAN
jgi:hypothetical protein